jgi:patatin-like phospholipase/acyl hydrolase
VRRILSIDGGGIKGVFPASFLATVEDAIGRPVADHFDMIVGTSTGGIIALGLGLGRTAREALRFYEELGPSVFSGWGVVKFFRKWVLAKYDATPLRTALVKNFGEKRLGESRKRLIIPSLNLETGEVHLFKTAHHPHLEVDYKVRAVDVALATGAAPTYFPSHVLGAGVPLVDGGVWANNPMAVAVVEAVGLLGWPRAEVRVLSLGCTAHPFNVDKARSWSLGNLYWADKITDLFMSGQASAALGMAQHLIGKENIWRINPLAPEGRYTLDGVKAMRWLKGLGETEARKALPQLREAFLQGPAEPFTPSYKVAADQTGRAVAGHFGAALS